MSAKQAQTEAKYTSVDPCQLNTGDEVIVQDAPDDYVRGIVRGNDTEWGRYGIIVEDEDGEVMCWEKSGRTFTRVEEAN